MKTFVMIFIIMIFIGYANKSSAKNIEKANLRYELSNDAYNNLIQGLKSDNTGLRKSCAYYIGKYKIEKALLPLMAQLRKEKDPELKILLATALYQIGDSRGLYLVKIISERDDNIRVKSRCSALYNEFLKSGNTVAAL